MPLPVYSPCMNLNSSPGDDQLELISSYFKQGYTNLEIIEVLKTPWNNNQFIDCGKETSNLGLIAKTCQYT